MQKKCWSDRWILPLLLLLFWGGSLRAQPMVLRGQVTDSEGGSPLPQLTVALRSGEQKILKYALTDKTGSFRLGFREGEEAVGPGAVLVFSYMGYEEQRIAVTPAEIMAGKGYSVRMKPGSLQIREVIVQAPKVQLRGDTVSYNVQSFANAQDKSIGDVLKRIPGIEVDEGGKVKYNGEPIQKFYIEGSDLLEGRYGFATQNIHQKDVAKVEVLENHQPVKALKNTSFSDKAAINIKLREGAKARWITQLSAGAGVSFPGLQSGSRQTEPPLFGSQKRHFLWDGSLFAMRIAGKNQSLNTFQTHNTGSDLTAMSKNFTGGDLDESLYSQQTFPEYLSVSSAGVPNMNGERTRFNKSLLFNSSNLWNLGRDYLLRGEVAYLYNKTECANLSGTEYFFEPGNRIDDEQLISVQTYQGMQGRVDLTSNTETYYLKNSLTADARWGDIHSSLQWRSRQIQNRVSQQASLPVLILSNEFRWVKNRRNTTFTLFSGNKFHLAPQRLEIFSSPEGEPEQGAAEPVQAFERIHTRTFLTDESLTFSTALRKWSLSAVGGFSALFRNMQRGDAQWDNRLGRLDGSLRLKAVYENGKFRAVFELPGGYSGFYFRGSLSGELPGSPLGSLPGGLRVATAGGTLPGGASVPEGGQWVWSPSISLRWKISSRFWVNLQSRVGKTPLSTDWFFSGTLLNNYKSVQQGAVYDAADQHGNLHLGLHYKDPLSLFYASASASYHLNRNSTLNNLIFTDTYLLNTLILQRNEFKGWNFRGEVSKGVDFLKGKVLLEGNYSLFDLQTMRNGVLSPYQSRVLSLKGYLSSEFADWGNLDYNILYGQNGVVWEGGKVSSSDFIKQQLSFHFTPLEWLTLKIQGEHYYTQISAELSKHLFWLDAGATFRVNKNVELALSVTNLLNTKTYSYMVYNGLSTVFQQYTLRPLNLLCTLYLKL